MDIAHTATSDNFEILCMSEGTEFVSVYKIGIRMRNFGFRPVEREFVGELLKKG